jgi:two-component system sensor histidine kinase KdpD
MEPYLQGTNLVLVYMSGVIYVALRSTRLGAWAAIVSSVAVFDFIFVAPRWAFKPTDSNFYFTFVVMAVVGLLVTELAKGVRQHASAVARTALAAETERIRTTLLQGLSHDFRTPLTTILGAADILSEHDAVLDSERRRTLLRGILGEAQRLSDLTDSLLDLTRMQEGAMKPRCEWCPAEELVLEVVRAMELRLAGREVRVHVGPGAVVWCDPRLVEQALVNLIDNALKHAPGAGAIDITLVVGARDWSLAVADEGPGLPHGQEGVVFEKFQRGPAAPREGVGLGLALCAAIARLHGGSTIARNAPGAQVVMTLPQPALQPEELQP